MARFFINRPVFAWVLAIVTMLAGALAVTTLPVSQYPDISPTTVRISATYRGASATAVRNSVTSVIESGLTGLDGLLYMVSSSSEGSSSITLTFGDNVDPNDAQIDVQNKLERVTSQLPETVQQAGVSVSRSSSSILMVGALVSQDGRYDTVELGDLLDQVVSDPIQRTEGVGGINVFGSGYAMRIWLDPLSLYQYQLTPADIVSAVEAQNTTVTVGSLGSQPSVQGQQLTATITAQSQLTSVEEFEQILLKTTEDGASVYLGDVAKIEIGQETYGGDSRFNGLPAAGFGVNLATGANAVDTAAAVRETLASVQSGLPDGVEVFYAYDTAPFVELSIEKVYETLLEAVALVFLVMLVFLQNWRATLIPTIAVPVVLLGTFGVLSLLGYSINTLTMFAMVLAIGLLVDDAIVVVENVERIMAEEKLPPREATIKSMGQITSALVGIALVLSAVFLPMAFFGGSTGVIYRQFSVTIISAMILSAAVALILTPALCASLLKPAHGETRFAPARWFNNGFDRTNRKYTDTVRILASRPMRMFVVLLAIGGLVALLYARLPSSFLPQEDQGVLMTMIELPEGSTTQQTLSVVKDVEAFLLEEEQGGVESVFTAMGFGFSGSGQNTAMIFSKLRDFDERSDSSLSASAIAMRANMHFASSRAGRIIVMQPPAIMGLGNSSGFTMYLIDQSGNGMEALVNASRSLVASANSGDHTANVRASGTDDKSALRIDIDQQKAEALGLSLSEVNAMMSIIFSGSEVNDFQLGVDLRPVIVQADAKWRMQPDDLDGWYARNSSSEMVPFSAFMSTSWVTVSPSISAYGGTTAIEISGEASAGASTGEAMDAMEELVEQMPGGYGAAWTGISYQERQSGTQAPYLYALSVLVVFLCLAALYESWMIPMSVMLAVPVGVLGALVAALLFSQSNDVYFKVGLLTTIGLAAKNAILIVEFARNLETEGNGLIEATVTAAYQRLRPILMTSFAFLLGVLPLAVATGAGANAQNAIGIGVFGGMLTATFLGIFMVPSFYVLIRRYIGREKPLTGASE